ncbi:MAG: hypothetical protein ACKO96_35605, partial [Flammeovirgaceae bacterium]
MFDGYYAVGAFSFIVELKILENCHGANVETVLNVGVERCNTPESIVPHLEIIYLFSTRGFGVLG